MIMIKIHIPNPNVMVIGSSLKLMFMIIFNVIMIDNIIDISSMTTEHKLRLWILARIIILIYHVSFSCVVIRCG